MTMKANHYTEMPNAAIVSFIKIQVQRNNHLHFMFLVDTQCTCVSRINVVKFLLPALVLVLPFSRRAKLQKKCLRKIG